MQVKSIVECFRGSILLYFRPALSYHLSLRPSFYSLNWRCGPPLLSVTLPYAARSHVPSRTILHANDPLLSVHRFNTASGRCFLSGLPQKGSYSGRYAVMFDSILYRPLYILDGRMVLFFGKSLTRNAYFRIL